MVQWWNKPNFCRFMGSSVLKASTVKCRLMTLIDTLDWHSIYTPSTLHRHLGWQSIDTRSTFLSTVGWQSTEIFNGCTWVGQQLADYQPTVDQVSMECQSRCQPRCQSSVNPLRVDWGYQLTLDPGCLLYTWSDLCPLTGITKKWLYPKLTP